MKKTLWASPAVRWVVACSRRWDRCSKAAGRAAGREMNTVAHPIAIFLSFPRPICCKMETMEPAASRITEFSDSFRVS